LINFFKYFNQKKIKVHLKIHKKSHLYFMKKLLTILFTFSTLILVAQTPANNECQTAVNLGKAPSCTNTVYTNKNATKTDIGSNNNPFCPNDGNVDADVWFSFIASDTIFDYTISVKSEGINGMKNPNVGIFRGSCGKDNLLKICANSPNINASEYSFNLYGLTQGEIYYIRVSDSGAQGDFKVCVTEIKSLTIDQVSTSACAGILYDTGGPTGNYKANENYVFKIAPSDPHKCIKLDFTYYNIDQAGDEIKIYDGPNTSSPVIATITGTQSKGNNSGAVAYSVSAKSGTMTISFKSDGDVTFEGFEATWQCSPDECTTSKKIVVNPNTTEKDIIASVSANGTLVKLDTIICDKRAYATFTGVNSDLGLEKGLILSSGIAKEAAGIGADFRSTPLGKPGDADLNKLSTQISNDACVVQFDVFASTDEINFEYVFGSEEYPQFVNSFNDIFAFMISGPGIVGDPALGTKKNMAIIPGTNSPVEINSLNTNVNWQFYRDNANGQSVAYNGLTSDKLGVKKSLTARSTVTPCKTYKLKMAIADRGDSAYDSGVFVSDIKGASPELTLISPNKIDYLVEKCTGVNDKVKVSLYKALAVNTTYAVKIGGTATNGSDYTLAMPNAIVFPAGTTELSFPIIPIADNTVEGIETITITLSRDFGCGSVDLVTKTIKINDQLDIKIELGADTVKICTNGDGKQIYAEGASFYTWSPASIFNNAQIPDPIVKPITSQKIYVTGQVGTCVGKDSAFAQVFSPNVKIKALTATDVCEGEIIKLQAENNVNDQNLQWGPPFIQFSNTNAPIVTIKAVFSFPIFVTAEAGGCTVSDTFDINVFPINMPFVFPDTTVCQGYPVLLATQSFGNSTFEWSPATGLDNPNKSNAIAKPKKTTQYILTGTSADGTCTAKDTILVKVIENEVTIQGADTLHICKGDSLVLNAKTSSLATAANFKWSSKSVSIKEPTKTSTKAAVWKTGWVYAQFTGSGCTSKDSVFVIKDSLPNDLQLMAIKDKQPYCEGDTVLLYSNSILKPMYPKAKFMWTDAVNSAISPLTNVNLLLIAKKTNNYYRTITNGACVRKDTFKMTVLPVIKPTGLKDTSVCEGVKVQLNITNAKDYDSFAWDPPSGLSCKDCPNPIAQIGTYTVTAKVQGKCPATATVVISPKNKPLVVAGATVCQGQAVNVPLTLNPAGVTNIKWTPSVGLSCDNCATPTATKLGTYEVTGILNTCNAKTSVTISELDTIMIINPTGKLCDLDKVQLNIADDKSFTNIQWIPSANLSCNNCANPTTSTQGTYYVKATKYGKCKSTGKVEVLVSNMPQTIVVSTTETNLCPNVAVNLPITVSTPGLTNVVWTPTLNAANPVATDFGTYTINANLKGCKASGSVTINKIDTIMEATVSGKICDEKKATITIKKSDDYKNYKFIPNTPQNGFILDKPGIYYIKALTKTGNCSTTAKITAEAGVTTPIAIKAEPSQLVLQDQEVKLTASGDVESVKWDFGATGVIVTDKPNIDSVRTYTVSALSKDGCQSSASINVYVVKVPRVITPEDSRGGNNFFKAIKFTKAADIQEIVVFNRWGEVVYKAANNDGDGWNGSYTGKDDYVPTDVYIYYIKAKMKNSDTIVTLSGEVMVLR
jgi:gliding motility-associated-like protein